VPPPTKGCSFPPIQLSSVFIGLLPRSPKVPNCYNIAEGLTLGRLCVDFSGMKTRMFLLWACVLGVNGVTAQEHETALRLPIAQSFNAGEEYLLDIRFVREGVAKGKEGNSQHAQSFGRDCRYRAKVVVAETDPWGTPVVETHFDPKLEIFYEGEQASFGVQDGAIQVAWTDDGLRITSNGQELGGELFLFMQDALQEQRTRVAFNLILDPKRPVRAGESWEVNTQALKDYLKQEQVTLMKTSAKARVQYAGIVQENGESYHVVTYTVPLEWIKVPTPKNAFTSETEGTFSGRLLLPLGEGSRRSVADLEYRAFGSQNSYPVARPVNWEVENQTHREVTVTPINRALAGNTLGN